METLTAKVGNVLIGSGNRIVPQTMCNTHTSDVEGTVAQCERMHEAGAGLIRITCPGMGDVKYMKEIREKLRAMGIDTPLVRNRDRWGPLGRISPYQSGQFQQRP